MLLRTHIGMFCLQEVDGAGVGRRSMRARADGLLADRVPRAHQDEAGSEGVDDPEVPGARLRQPRAAHGSAWSHGQLLRQRRAFTSTPTPNSPTPPSRTRYVIVAAGFDEGGVRAGGVGGGAGEEQRASRPRFRYSACSDVEPSVSQDAYWVDGKPRFIGRRAACVGRERVVERTKKSQTRAPANTAGASFVEYNTGKSPGLGTNKLPVRAPVEDAKYCFGWLWS